MNPVRSEIPIYQGLAPLAENYDGFIVDLWGVLHDGIESFPAAVDCLVKLHQQGKRILILSNAPRRAEVVAARNVELGIDRALWDAVMSSGEDAWQHLKQRPDNWYRALGQACYHLGPDRDLGMREGLDYDFVDDITVADFILVTGTLLASDTAESYADLFAAARRRGLPMICANPDLEVIRGGQREICAGALAQYYETLGGELRYHGKPHRSIYDVCLPLLAVTDRSRIAAIGDSLRTDIAGAAKAGIDSLFVISGIHGEALGADRNGNVDPDRLAALYDAEGQHPNAAMPLLQWS